MNLPDYLTRDDFGEIRLTGHRIGLYTVVRCFKEGWSADRMNEEFPSLPVALINQVLGFYQANQAEADAYVNACRKRSIVKPPCLRAREYSRYGN